MIDIYQVIILGLIQGLTEFLPISSSAHLVIPSLLLDWADQGLAFDVAVHVGTLSAVMIYYRADLMRMADRWSRSLAGAPACDDSRLVWYLALATVPAGAAGLLAGVFIEENLRSLPVIATTTLLFGIFLGMADRHAGIISSERKIGFSLAILIGCAQMLALVPGVSRSGITMTAALFLGMNRQASARFSFLLSIPIIASAGLLKIWELVTANEAATVNWFSLGLGAVVSGLAAYVCIATFLRLINKVGFMPFVYYRIGLAAILYLFWLI